MATNRAQADVPPGMMGQTVTIPVSLRLESFSASGPSLASSHEDELREMRAALQEVREELRQVRLSVAELVRITYESVARLDSLTAPGTHVGAAQRPPAQSDGLQEAPQRRDAGRPPAVTPQRPGRGGSAARGRWQQHSRPAAVQTQKKKPVPSAELLSDLSAKQDSDPVVCLVKKAVSAGQELTRQEREAWPKESQLLMRQWSRLELWNGVLYRRACLSNGAPPIRQLVTSSESVCRHIQAAHKRMGHCGAERLLKWARGQLFSPGLATQVEQLIGQCEKCGAAQGGRQASKTSGGHAEIAQSRGSPEVYALAPDQDPDQDPDTILLFQHSDSRGSSPCEGYELGPVKNVPASPSRDVGQPPLCQKGRLSSPPPLAAAAAEPLAGAETSSGSVGPSLAENERDNLPAGLCSQPESPGCGVAGNEGLAIEA